MNQGKTFTYSRFRIHLAELFLNYLRWMDGLFRFLRLLPTFLGTILSLSCYFNNWSNLLMNGFMDHLTDQSDFICFSW